MIKKMYSFRFNKNLIDNAKRIAKEMDISLSFFISWLIREKISGIKSKNKDKILFSSNENIIQVLQEVVTEIRGLRSDLNKAIKK